MGQCFYCKATSSLRNQSRLTESILHPDPLLSFGEMVIYFAFHHITQLLHYEFYRRNQLSGPKAGISYRKFETLADFCELKVQSYQYRRLGYVCIDFAVENTLPDFADRTVKEWYF